MDIKEFKSKLRAGEVRFTFKKKDGSLPVSFSFCIPASMPYSVPLSLLYSSM